MTKHIPVLLDETIENLNLVPGGVYVDATLGGGGHLLAISRKLLAVSSPASRSLGAGWELMTHNSKPISTIIGLDQDEKAIELFKKRIISEGGEKLREDKFLINNCEVILKNTNFENLKTVLEELKIKEIHGVVADLGISTDQLEDEGRGFSFKKGKKLDLRMDENLSVSGADLLNALYKKEIIELLQKYGDIREAKRIAENIVQFRESQKIETIDDLLTIINKAVNVKRSRNLVARVIQALRIAVNHELVSLHSFLPQVLEPLAQGCSVCIITFHSGEDRIVKRLFRVWSHDHKGDHELVYPTEDEIRKNSKASSAKLRIFTKK